MKIDDILLMLYVDGELASEDRLEVEKAIEESVDIAGRVTLLEASNLPFREAFARQKLPPVPDRLKRKVDALVLANSVGPEVAVHDKTALGTGAVVNNRSSVVVRSVVSRSAPVRSQMRETLPWLAVAFVAGAFCWGVALRLAPGELPGSTELSTSRIADGGASPWVRAAVSYQQLYTRDTVALDAPSPDISTRTVSDIRHEDGLELRIPDLSSMGLTFKRVQRLRFHDKPLVQIVYLPQKGVPIALCVTKDAKPDAAVAQLSIDGMDVVTWRQANLDYALLAAPGVVDLIGIGKQIAGSNVGALFRQQNSMANEGTG
jgi:anti-sigma factor RsiW